jgi:hypothetical protein
MPGFSNLHDGGIVMRHRLLISLVAVSFMLATSVSAIAADKTKWFGKSVNSKRYLFVKDGDTWTLGSSVDAWDDTEWRAVSKTGDYIELQLKNADVYARIRLYEDKMIANTPLSSGKWVKYATGNWVGD